MTKEIPTQSEPQPNAAKPLLGKVAVITGSSKGIGRGFALELARRGAKVVINYSTAQSDDAAQQLVKEIAALEASPSPQCITVKADLRNPSSAPEIIRQTVEAFGPRIDILINNAATSITKPTPDITPEDFDSVFHLNVRAPLLMMQAMLPYLGSGSRIVNISSIAARRATEQICLYHSSKAALEALTHQWSMELAPNGHTVNTVSPGPVMTDILALAPPGVTEAMKAQTPAGRLGTIDDVVQVVAWLVGEESRWINGQTINVSGALTMY